LKKVYPSSLSLSVEQKYTPLEGNISGWYLSILMQQQYQADNRLSFPAKALRRIGDVLKLLIKRNKSESAVPLGINKIYIFVCPHDRVEQLIFHKIALAMKLYLFV
jgi:hypothetical protein